MLVGDEGEVGFRAPLCSPPLRTDLLLAYPKTRQITIPRQGEIGGIFDIPLAAKELILSPFQKPRAPGRAYAVHRQKTRVPSLEGTRWWAGKDLNLRRLSQRIYSPPPLATWVPAQDTATIIPIPGKLSTPGLGFAIERLAQPRLPIFPRQARLRNLARSDLQQGRGAWEAKIGSLSRGELSTPGLGIASERPARHRLPIFPRQARLRNLARSDLQQGHGAWEAKVGSLCLGANCQSLAWALLSKGRRGIDFRFFRGW